MVIRLIISIALAMVAGAAYAAIDKQVLQQQDIQRSYFSDQYVTINVADQPLHLLVNDTSTVMTRGVALLVSDSGTSAVSQQGLAPLAQQLNALGWVTIIVPVPDTEFVTPTIEITSSDEQPQVAPLAISSASQLDLQAYQAHLSRLTTTMQAALQKAADYQGFILVVAQGTSAASLAQLYNDQSLSAPDALVAVDAYWPDRQFNQQLANVLAQTPMPVLDLYSQGHNQWSNSGSQLRKVAALKSLKMHYRQRQLLGLTLPHQSASYISKEIYGWLTRMGW